MKTSYAHPGPVMLDVAAYEVTSEEREILQHPLVGGVILFARNYAEPEQLRALTTAIRAARPELLISVDHEGGRVQRFRDGFTRLPAMRRLGEGWSADPEAAKQQARHAGFVLAAELRAHGVDLSYAPVLDLDYGVSSVIGDRAFHRDPLVATELARAVVAGLADVGMRAVGKHFPGHGAVEADSHVAIPVDSRSFDEVWKDDVQPFRLLAGELGGVMPAHVIFENIEPRPAGFSAFWLQEILRGKLGFEGVIFSDDLTMEGASVAGGIVARAEAAHSAGCDMVLVCNRPDFAVELLDGWQPAVSADSSKRIAALRPRPGTAPADPATLAGWAPYRAARESVLALA
ncbi:MAG: beta-N-acetylhexosaminidase [Zoogloea oleivorans]|jgi:beta-N-acetylhexosaminidase|uniref:beta-N-acetylhexosaminidase n=1 Tax=Zoogloea oleivorans TaxID=1552750 RepID=UPI002A35DB9B|nr:beta-N-acetylhexosaminidase [Zoogloea oleivorans]MDY0035676.1 beta-N-acetylhexosaminidase [Zoogloea oleivorans]